MALQYEGEIGMIIWRGDTVTLLNSIFVGGRRHGNHCGVVLGSNGRDPDKLVVRLHDGSKASVNLSDVRLADRSFMQPSMVVASSSSDNGGQLGKVLCAGTELDLCRLPSPDGEHNAPSVVVARAVSPAELRRAGGEFSVGDYVVSVAGPSCAWLGCVVEVCLDVDVLFDDGAKCRVIARGHDTLWTTPATVNKDASTNKDLYPGLRVRGPPGIFRASRWLKGYWKPNHGVGTVSRVETTSVVVHWVASSSHLDVTATDGSLPAPSNQQNPHDLTFFCSGNVFDCRFWGVGDRCFFRGAPAASAGGSGCDDQQKMSAATAAADRGLMTRRRRLWLGAKRTLRPSRRQLPLAVASTRTTMDVLWQDGTRQRGVPSTSLVVMSTDIDETDQEFFPGQHVVRRTPVTGLPEKEELVGVVRRYSYEDQTVRVSWTMPESDEEETLSSYDLSRVSDHYYYGDIVVRRLQTDSPSATADDDLSWVGHVIDTCDDDSHYIKVKWGNGSTSMVLFHEIAVIKERRLDDLLHELGEWVDEDGDMNNTNGEDNDDSGSDDDNSSGSDTDDGSGSESDSEDDGHKSMRRMNRIGVIIQAAIRLASKVFAQGKRYPVSGLTEAETSRSQFTTTKGSTELDINGGVGDGRGSTTEDKAEADATGDDTPLRFPQFEIVQQSPLDHHYLDNMKEGTGGGRKWTKRVQKEWKILANNNLPDTIYVQVFEDRMDLLRAVMVGASGTPYHDGLFFFDLQLPPSSYPAEPPLVNYRSFGHGVNPNLYPSGTVCLSLLNTFGAQDEAELWSPEASTILQVVVSIQGLVLTAQPYYNEPAWAPADTLMGQRSELPYSESTFLQSLQTMLHLLRRPPAGFEEFVRDHFRRRGQHVIRACEAYLDGCIVGTLDEEGNSMEGSKKRPCSAGFRIALLNVLPRLVEAFASIDAQGC